MFTDIIIICKFTLIDYIIYLYFFFQKYGTRIKEPCQLLQDVSFSLLSLLCLE